MPQISVDPKVQRGGSISIIDQYAWKYTSAKCYAFNEKCTNFAQLILQGTNMQSLITPHHCIATQLTAGCLSSLPQILSSNPA